MKSLIFSISLFFSANTFANQNIELISKTGKTPTGEACIYAVYEMNNWEGQTVIFMNGPNGNFRVELDTDALKLGDFVSPYNDVEMSYVNNELHTVVPRAEQDDTDNIVNIVFNSEGILDPAVIDATHAPEELSCQF